MEEILVENQNLVPNEDELSSIFEEISNNLPVQPEANLVGEGEEYSENKDYGQRILEKIEAEYKNAPDVEAERFLERKSLEERLKTLDKKLKGTKNVKNIRMRTLNAEKAAKRKLYRSQIEEIKDALYNLSLEEKGAGVTSTNLVDATIKSSLEEK